jgi:hypothetical protein
MDINILAVFAICGLYGVLRIHQFRMTRQKTDLLRARVAWMLWSAADQVR